MIKEPQEVEKEEDVEDLSKIDVKKISLCSKLVKLIKHTEGRAAY